MKQADEAYRRALRLCLCGLPVHRDEAAANRIALATIACQEYRWSDAVRLARRAFREAESSADFRHAVAAQRLIGYALDYLGRYEEAETTLRAALERSRREGADVETVRLLVLIGCFHYGQATLRPGPYAEAIACLQRALAEAERSHSFYPLLDAKLRLGWCALAEGRTDDAVTWFGAITPALPAEAHRELSVGARLGLAAGAHQRGSLEEAGQQYETVVGLAEQNDFVGYEASALVGLGTVQWHLGRRPGAEATWRDARRLAKLHSPRTQQFTEVNLRACVSAPNVPPR
jgi:tetratricopeptide (TPR) repeat protein